MNEQRWVAFQARASRTQAVCGLDNDGVLSPTVPDPTTSRPTASALSAVTKLAAVAPTFVLSGRTLDFLELCFPVEGLDLVGLFGRQWRLNGSYGTHPDASRDRVRVERFWADIRNELDREGIPTGSLYFEDKAGLVATVGWRPLVHRISVLEQRLAQDPDRQDLRQELDLRREHLAAVHTTVTSVIRSVASAHGLEARVGRMSSDIAGAGFDKGKAIEAIVRRYRDIRSELSAVLFVGDEERDRPAFAALDKMAANGIVPARVLVDNEEASDSLRGCADVLLDSVQEVPGFLMAVARSINPRQAGPESIAQALA